MHVLDEDAAVLHDVESGVSGFFGGGFVGDAELHPDHLRADGDRFIDDRRSVLRLAEYIDNFDQVTLFSRNRRKRRPAFKPEHFAERRIDRIDGVPRLNHVPRHTIARPLRLVRKPDDGDMFVFREYRCDVHRDQGEALHQSCWQRAVPDNLPENTGIGSDSQRVRGKFVGWGEGERELRWLMVVKVLYSEIV